MASILLASGPNLNLLGEREPEIYGRDTLDELVGEARAVAEANGHSLDHVQSNHEGEIVDAVQQARNRCAAIVINPGAFSHYSLAIYDCLQALALPVVEVHLSNIHAREEFRSKSVTARAARGVITGLGFKGYELALRYLAEEK